MGDLTDWELGNSIMCKLVDEMKEISGECKNNNPYISKLLLDLATDFGSLVNDLMDQKMRMCPEDLEYFTYFDGRQIYRKRKLK